LSRIRPARCLHRTSCAWLQLARDLSTGSHPPPVSGPRLLDVLSAERRRARAAELNSDLRRGYFDDFRDAAKKVVSPGRLIATSEAVPLPALPFIDAAGAATTVSAPGLTCVVFRAGAAHSLSTWTPALVALLSNTPGLVFTQLSVVEPWLYGLPGVRSLLLRAGRTLPLGGEQGQHAFIFGMQHSDSLRRQLGLSNRLCAHMLLLDAKARVRWKAAGDADPTELQALPRLVADMMRE